MALIDIDDGIETPEVTAQDLLDRQQQP